MVLNFSQGVLNALQGVLNFLQGVLNALERFHNQKSCRKSNGCAGGFAVK